MNTEKIIGALLITGAIAVLIPYTLLTMTFDYPGILRQSTGHILTRFYAGGPSLLWTWWAFAVVGLPLLGAYILIGQKLDSKLYFVRWATTLGVISIITQFIGLLRWTFVVPVLATTYVRSTSEATRAACEVVFQAVHQYGGVVLGEHVGQSFTIAWTVMMALAFARLRLFPRWVSWFGYVSAGIYLLAQADLFATVLPGIPVWTPAGLLGSTLWLVWLVIVGVKFRHVTIDRGDRLPTSSR